MSKPRLTRQNWIDTGLRVLAQQGPGALAAEPLARTMGTTKGSFYWHFKDVAAYHAEVVADWQTRAFAQVLHALEEDGAPDDRLRRFGVDLLSDPVEMPLRGWANTDKTVAKALAQVDAERLTYVASLLAQLGLKNPGFARACIGALVGMPQLPGAGQKASVTAYDTMIDTVLALR